MKRTALALTLISALLFSTVAGSQFGNFASAQSFLTITIKADGSINPATAPISQSGNVYTLTGNVSGSLTIKKGGIILDGAGYTIKCGPSLAALTLEPAIPLYREYINNVIIRNVVVTQDESASGSWGILMRSTNNSIIANNTISNLGHGIIVDIYGTGNIIVGNNVTNINGNGIYVWTTNNTIIGNYITETGRGIDFSDWTDNTVFGNHIADNQIAINCWAGNPIIPGLENLIYYNNFINNTWHFLCQVSEGLYPTLINIWDNGTVGNYWSDYNGTDDDGDGIGDTPYFVDDHSILDANDTDHFPLMNPIEVVVQSVSVPSPSPSPSPSPIPTPPPSPTATPSLEPTPTPEIPEFPFWAILSLLIIAPLFVLILKKKGFYQHKKSRD